MRIFVSLAFLALTGFLASFLGTNIPVRAEDQNADIVGTYKIIGGQEGNQKIPAEELKDHVVHIMDHSITVIDGDKKDIYSASYQLDTSKRPWTVQMTSTLAPVKGVKSHGLIQRDGDKLKLIYSLPGGEAPTSFEPEEKQQMFILQKKDAK